MINSYIDGMGHTRKIKYRVIDGKLLLLVQTKLVQDQHGNSYEDDQLIGLDIEQLKAVIIEMTLLGAPVIWNPDNDIKKKKVGEKMAKEIINKYRVAIVGQSNTLDVPEVNESEIFRGFLTFKVNGMYIWHVPKEQIVSVVEIGIK